MNTRVLIATNEPMLAKGLEAVLAVDGVEVAAVCGDVMDLFAAFHNCDPDIAILDLPMLPDVSVIGELRRQGPRCQIVLWPRPSLGRERIESAVRWGARGMLPPNVPPSRLCEVVHMLAGFPEPMKPPAALVNQACSQSERELIALVGYGMNDGEIAAVMHSDQGTVQKLMSGVCERLGVQDRYELALYGLSTISEPANSN